MEKTSNYSSEDAHTVQSVRVSKHFMFFLLLRNNSIGAGYFCNSCAANILIFTSLVRVMDRYGLGFSHFVLFLYSHHSSVNTSKLLHFKITIKLKSTSLNFCTAILHWFRLFPPKSFINSASIWHRPNIDTHIQLCS